MLETDSRCLRYAGHSQRQVVHWIGKPEAEARFGAPARERSGMHALISALRI